MDFTLTFFQVECTVIHRVDIPIKLIIMSDGFTHLYNFIRKGHIFIFSQTVVVVIEKMRYKILNRIVRVFWKLRVEKFIPAIQ